MDFIFSEENYPESTYLDLFKDNQTTQLNNIALINNKKFNEHIKFFIRGEMSIKGFLKPKLDNNTTYSNIFILKNNLFEENYPKYDKKYLGALWAIRANKDKVRFTILSKNLSCNFDYLLELDTYGLDGNVDRKYFNDDDIQEIKNMHQKAENDYAKFTNFSIELPYDKLNNITILGEALEANV